MRRSLSASLLILFLLAPAAAVADKKHPDLSGSWQVDREKSDYGEWSDKPLSKADSTLVIAHVDPELKIRRTLALNGREEVKEFTYYTDGRGETNPATLGAGEVKSKTKWDGDKVVAEAHITRQGAGGSYELNVTQKWQVSSDGKTLTNTTTIGNQMGAQQIKLVYRRAQ
ncbi:MAG: hypothetical protein JOZ96_05425 [Acidobacteria bacterium]|nr:hypothetical protein [Acidobacteriota bacterium]